MATGRIGLYAVAIELCQAGVFEPAAVLMGASDSMGTGSRPLADWAMALASATDAILLEQFGEAQLAELTARGASLTFADAVDYARAGADAVLRSAPGA